MYFLINYLSIYLSICTLYHNSFDRIDLNILLEKLANMNVSLIDNMNVSLTIQNDLKWRKISTVLL